MESFALIFAAVFSIICIGLAAMGDDLDKNFKDDHDDDLK